MPTPTFHHRNGHGDEIEHFSESYIFFKSTIALSYHYEHRIKSWLFHSECETTSDILVSIGKTALIINSATLKRSKTSYFWALLGLELSGASSVSMLAGFITSGNAGAEVYGVTYNTFKVVHQAIFISRDPDIYEMKRRLPYLRGFTIPSEDNCSRRHRLANAR